MTNKNKRIKIDLLPIAPKTIKKIPLPSNQFPAASLSSWDRIVRASGVPSIPVDIIDDLHIESLLRSDEIMDREGNIKPGMEFAHTQITRLTEINKKLNNKDMLRWDICAPLNLKKFMATSACLSAIEEKKKPLIIREFNPFK